MKVLYSFGAFWWDFLVGDAWEVAAGVVATLAAVMLLVPVAPTAAELTGLLVVLAVVVLMGASLAREASRH